MYNVYVNMTFLLCNVFLFISNNNLTQQRSSQQFKLMSPYVNTRMIKSNDNVYTVYTH